MQTAIENIVHDFDEQISEFICRKVNHEDCCHDIKQNVYVKVINNIDKIERAENPRSYLFKMANNAVIDHYRVKSSMGNDEISEDLGLPDDHQAIDRSLQLESRCLPLQPHQNCRVLAKVS